MRIFNYSNYAKTIEKGMDNKNITELATVLFEPIISNPDLLNQAGNPYYIDSKLAKNWYDQVSDIPKKIKSEAAQVNKKLVADYFNEKVLNSLINGLKVSKVCHALLDLIKESNLNEDVKKELLNLHNDGDTAKFLSTAFLYSLVENNKLKDDENEVIQNTDEYLIKFNKLIKEKYKKPALIIPETIEQHEIGYVEELYKVYSEKMGKECKSKEDLNGDPKLKRNFDTQRKSYYSAEIIRRELRDTMLVDEENGFNLLKDEVYNGVIDVRNKEYDLGYDRLTAVMEHATSLPISNNLDNILLNWVGASEKKGVCHMLVNDNLLSWMEDEDDENE